MDVKPIQDDERVTWFLNARHKFVWDLETISGYVDPFLEIVWRLITEGSPSSAPPEGPWGPTIGLMALTDAGVAGGPSGYALYVADARLPPDRRNTLFSRFKGSYRVLVGSAFEGDLFAPDEAVIKAVAPPGRAEQLLLWRSILVKDFNSIAERSLNRRRRIPPQLRYRILARDNSTCRICARSAPQVRVHVDHIKPVSWDLAWSPSDDPNDYQVLCEACNLGKGSMSWLASL